MKSTVKTAISLIAVIFASAPVLTFTAHAEETASLSLEVAGIKDTNGTMRIALFKDEQGWASQKSVASQAVEVTSDDFTTVFEGLEPGQYGIRLYYDENANGKLDLGVMGIPKESFAFSNDAPVQFGPPKWSAAAFEITEGENPQLVHLK